jgi:hypothetical protein
MQLYQDRVHDPKFNAQQNLSGRTHYVDDDTLRAFKSRILSTHITDGGLLFSIVESCQGDYEGTFRVFRPVIFNIFGEVVYKPSIDESFKTRKAATEAMWDHINDLNAVSVTKEGIKRAQSQHKREMRNIRWLS